jgi:glycine/D-amino acid oxidase-like deaminating enzyme
MMSKRVIVVGAGIIGASIALHLAQAGAQVTVIEAAEPGGVATQNSWGWINASWGNPEPYFRLRVRSIELWSELAQKLPGLPVNFCGGLIWDLEPAALEDYARERKAWGYSIRRVGRSEILKLEPNLKSVPDHAYHAAGEGVAEPVATALALLEAAKDLGAEVLANTPIKWLVENDERITGVMADVGVIHADEIVIAAGAETATLLDTIGITLKMSAPAGLLSHMKPADRLLNGLVMTPGLHIRQTSEGRIVAGTDFAGADPEGNAEGLAADLAAKVQAMVKGAENLGLDFHTVGYRPTPADGFSAVGRPRNRTGLYVAVTHSGVTLAPAIGHFAAQEILTGERHTLLVPFHPDRPALA